MSDPWKPGDPERRQRPHLTAEDLDAVAQAVAAVVAQHPPQCLLGLDPDTVMALKEIAEGYRNGKRRVLGLLLKLAMYGLFVGAIAALANIDVKGLLRGMFGLNP